MGRVFARPRAFARVSRRGTPQPALVFITGILLALALTGAFEFLMRFMMAVAVAVAVGLAGRIGYAFFT